MLPKKKNIKYSHIAIINIVKQIIIIQFYQTHNDTNKKLSIRSKYTTSKAVTSFIHFKFFAVFPESLHMQNSLLFSSIIIFTLNLTIWT